MYLPRTSPPLPLCLFTCEAPGSLVPREFEALRPLKDVPLSKSRTHSSGGGGEGGSKASNQIYFPSTWHGTGPVEVTV